jgi:hypothetical protein
MNQQEASLTKAMETYTRHVLGGSAWESDPILRL